MKTVNGGNAWTSQFTGSNETFNSMAFLNSTTGMVGGSGGVILKTTNGGTNWTTASPSLPGTVKLVSFVGNPPVAIAIGEGFQAVSLDSGTTWRTTSLGDTMLGGVNAIARHPGGSLWIAKANGSIISNTLLALTGVTGGLSGGLSARVGDTIRINVAHKDIAQITVEFSPDSGATWAPIGSLTPVGNLSVTTSSLVWVVPNTLTTKGRFRAFNTGRPSETDTLAGTFTILPALVPTLVLTAPAGGETWTGGSTRTITWTSTHIDSVSIQYTYNGTQWINLATKVLASTGSLTWTVPDTGSTTVKVRIANLKNPGLADTSAAFTTTKSVVGVDGTAQALRFGLADNTGLTGAIGRIRFQLAVPAASVTVSLRDVRGTIVAKVISGPLTAGHHVATVDLARLPAGAYFCELEAGSFKDVERVMRLP
jgi:hypothetical protein